jgi:hypothetical protein
MDTRERIGKEIAELYDEGLRIAQAFLQKDEKQSFPGDYQDWYTKALRIVEVIASDRYSEFKSYYEIDPKRKSLGYGTYVIQDYLKGVAPSSYDYPKFDSRKQVAACYLNQLMILKSLVARVKSILSDIDAHLLSELQDAELETARGLTQVSIRAAGALVGVVVEGHLQKLTRKHSISIRKKNPTIGDMSDALKSSGILDTPTWRKITYLADIRNLCTHKKDSEPTKEQVAELIDGANWLIKTIF